MQPSHFHRKRQVYNMAYMFYNIVIPFDNLTSKICQLSVEISFFHYSLLIYMKSMIKTPDFGLSQT